MKPAILFIDDDSNILDAVGPNIRLHTKNRINYVVELQSITELQDFLRDPKERHPVVAVVDLWFNDFDANTSDQEGGFKIVSLLKRSFPKLYVIIFSAHLTAERISRLKLQFQGVTILSKGEGTLDSLLAEIDVGLKSANL